MMLWTRLKATTYIEMTLIRLYHYQELANSLSPIRIKAGLPNIKAYSGVMFHGKGDCSGAFLRSNTLDKSGIANGSGSGYDDLYFDASRSNLIYGNSATVTPNSQTCKLILRY